MSSRAFRGPLVLLLFLVLTNFNIIFLGQSLVATANSNPIGGEPQALHPGLFHGGSPSVNWYDLGVAWWQWEPAGKMIERAFRSGHIPMWDSEIGGGIDSHVSINQTQYYPPYIALLLAGDTPLLRDFYYLAELYASGLFCYLFLRRNGFHLISAVCMGAVYMLGGSMTQNINSSTGQSFAVLPMMLWATDLVLRLATWRFVGIGAFLLALAGSTSFFPVVISGYLAAGLYVAVTVGCDLSASPAEHRRRAWIRGGKAIAAQVLSLLLLSFLLIPVELASGMDGTFSRWYRGLGLQHYSLDQMITLISPSVGFDLLQLANPDAQLFTAPPVPSPFYVGLIPLLLALLAFGKLPGRFQRLRIFFASATALLFLKLVGALPAQWIGLLPVFQNLHFIPYFCGALALGFAGLAGLGIEGLIHTSSGRTTAVGSLSLLAIALCVMRFDQTEALNGALQGAALWSAIAHYLIEVARLSLLAVSFLAILFLRGRYLKGSAAGFCLLTLAFLDLASLDIHQRYLRSDVWASPPEYLHFLRTDKSKFRIHPATDLALPADVSQTMDLDALSSRMVFNSTRYSEIMRKYFEAPNLPYPIARSAIPSSRVLLDILNVKYLVALSPDAGQTQQIISAGLAPVFQGGSYRVFQNQQVWDRAYLANAVIIVNRKDQELVALASLHPGEVLLEETPMDEYHATELAGKVDDLRYDFDDITAHVRANQTGLFVLGENYSPGWQATVGGKPAKLYRANYTFQAVAVPAGSSDVHFHYTPPGFHAGLTVSIIAGVLTLLLCFATRRAASTAPAAPNVPASQST
jgi:hypothetical protein